MRFAVAQGITQFLDIGSGIPTVGNSHEIARQADPSSRVAYVDIDPVAVAHSRAILAGDTMTTVLQADLRDTRSIVGDRSVRDLVDFDKPVAILLVAILHFIADADDPRAMIARLREAVVPGSLLVMSHASQDGQPELAKGHQELYARTPTPMTMRTVDQIGDLFTGFDLVDPGVVPIQQWRPETHSEVTDKSKRMVGFAGVGVKSGTA